MIFGKDNHKKQLFDKRNCLPSHKYLKSPVTNHETWPHYFSLMSCHTWQKYDTNNKNQKRFVSSGPISSFPSVPRQKTCFTGYTVAAPQGEGKKKKRKFKEVVVLLTGIKCWDIHKTSSFIRVLSPSLADEMKPPRVLFCPRWGGKRWNKEAEKRGSSQDVFPIPCHGHKSKFPKFHETRHPTSLHLFLFILFVVMQLWKLKAKGLWQSNWN